MATMPATPTTPHGQPTLKLEPGRYSPVKSDGCGSTDNAAVAVELVEIARSLPYRYLSTIATGTDAALEAYAAGLRAIADEIDPE